MQGIPEKELREGLEPGRELTWNKSRAVAYTCG